MSSWPGRSRPRFLWSHAQLVRLSVNKILPFMAIDRSCWTLAMTQSVPTKPKPQEEGGQIECEGGS